MLWACALYILTDACVQREGQSNEWSQTDADSLYKFEKRVRQARTVYIESQDRDGAIRHLQLAKEKNGRPDMSGHQYPPESMVRPAIIYACTSTLNALPQIYTLEDIEFPRERGRTITVPKGTRCWISTWTTRMVRHPLYHPLR